MIMLMSGVLLFACVHFVPTLAPAFRTGAIGRLGEGGYKGIFSLLLLASFALIIVGWRNTLPTPVYHPPSAMHNVALGLIAVAFLLLIVGARNSRLRSLVRHPQLTGVALWGVAHLLLNGDKRAIVLFGGMALWALIEMVVISRRQGVWVRTDAPSWGAEGVTLVIAALAIGVIIYLHPWFSGVPVHW
jgi:uncharacterized membrane protein